MTKIFALVVFIIVFFICLAPNAFAFSGSGSGTELDPYQISTCSQLQEIEDDLSAFYILTGDINCNGVSFHPIGDTVGDFFVGSLDGKGHKITNLTINSNDNGVGIFALISTGGVVTNIGLESGTITQQGDTVNMGSFAGTIEGGTITNSYSKASLDGSAANFISPVMGGLFGAGDPATVSNSYFSGNIVNATINQNYTGGIAGYMSAGSITNSYATGSMSNGRYVGGIAGRLFSGATITDSFTTTTFVNSSIVGGIVGQIDSGTISGSYWNDLSGGFMTCYSGGNTGCTRVSNNLSYFYTITNPPMSNWDFVNTWSVQNNGTSYPLLYWQAPNPTPSPTPSSGGGGSSPSSSGTSVSCTAQAPLNSPNLFQIKSGLGKATLYFAPVMGPNTAYTISYGFTPAANQYATTFNYGFSSGVIPYTINYLFPAKWYFKVAGMNNCMPGVWSQTQSVVVK